MKKIFLSMALLAAGVGFGQTLFVPSGTSGIGSSAVSGNVGIGTNAPAGKLDIRLGGWGNIPRVIFREINANPTMLFYRPTGSGTTTYPWSVSTNALAEMEFKTGEFANIGSEVLTTKFALGLNNSYFNTNLGIGTNLPNDKLHIVDNNPTIRLSSSSYFGGSGNGLNSVLGTIKFSNRDDNHIYRSEIRGILTGGWAEHVGLSFTTNASGIQQERMRINHDGNIGIGTSNPNSKLTVNGWSGGDINIVTQTGVFNNIGFNTTDKASTGRSYYGINYLKFPITGNTTQGPGVGLSGYYGLGFYTGDSEKMRITDSGNIGIGTQTPTEKLDVNGNINLSNALIPMGLNTELPNTDTPLLNLSVNFRGNGISNSKIGAAFRIDSRDNNNSINSSLPLFQWLYRESNSTSDKALMHMNSQGKLGIGFESNLSFPTLIGGTADVSNYKLFVKGGVLAEEVRVALNTTWADYVFAPSYQLKTIDEVASFIKENGHLPNVPSAKQVEAEGINVAEMSKIQMEKIEELTLYIIELKKEIDALKAKK